MILLDTTTQTGAGTVTGFPVRLDSASEAVEVLLNVTAAAAGATDTLNVYVQGTVDSGTTWDDIMSFTQVLGNGGVKKFLARWTPRIAPEVEMAAPTDATLAAGNVQQGPHGLLWRVKAVVVNVTAAAFTFKVSAGGDVEKHL